jgi:hypothetical protein
MATSACQPRSGGTTGPQVHVNHGAFRLVDVHRCKGLCFLGQSAVRFLACTLMRIARINTLSFDSFPVSEGPTVPIRTSGQFGLPLVNLSADAPGPA